MWWVSLRWVSSLWWVSLRWVSSLWWITWWSTHWSTHWLRVSHWLLHGSSLLITDIVDDGSVVNNIWLVITIILLNNDNCLLWSILRLAATEVDTNSNTTAAKKTNDSTNSSTGATATRSIISSGQCLDWAQLWILCLL